MNRMIASDLILFDPFVLTVIIGVSIPVVNERKYLQIMTCHNIVFESIEGSLTLFLPLLFYTYLLFLLFLSSFVFLPFLPLLLLVLLTLLYLSLLLSLTYNYSFRSTQFLLRLSYLDCLVSLLRYFIHSHRIHNLLLLLSQLKTSILSLHGLMVN
jgi:hypothetical protein